MILRDKLHTYVIHTGMYGKRVADALKKFDGFILAEGGMPCEAIRLPAGESIICFNEHMRWLLERDGTVCFFGQVLDAIEKKTKNHMPDFEVMLPIFEKLRGATPDELMERFGPAYEEYVGRPFNPLVQAKLMSIEKALESSDLSSAERAKLKKQWNETMEKQG